jgi:chromosome segregation ATPase
VDLKSYLMILIEDFKNDINNSLKEIQENTGKQVESPKQETQKSLKELWENISKQVKELNKTIQDLKMEVETIKTYGDRKPMKEIIDASITNRIQEMEERISGTEDTIEKIDTTIKENEKYKKILTQNTQEIQDAMRRPNLRIMSIEEREDS